MGRGGGGEGMREESGSREGESVPIFDENVCL